MCSRLPLQILRQLADGPASPYKLIPQQDGTLPEFYQVVQEVKKAGLVDDKDGVLSLTSSGNELVLSQSSALSNSICPSCTGRGYSLRTHASEILATFKEILKERPAPADEYDQQCITPENIMVRVAFMEDRGDLAGKEILIIGDDDMLSIALALTGLPKRVVVLEVDTRVNEFVNKVAKERNLPISAHDFDVRKAFPPHFKGQFDVFNCDPVETVEGFKLFVSAGLMSLKGIGSVCYFGLTSLEAGVAKWYKIQESLLQMNLVTTDIRRNFNEYEVTHFDSTFTIDQKLGINQKQHTWYWSALWRTEAIAQPKPAVVVNGKQIEFDIYRDEETWATPML